MTVIFDALRSEQAAAARRMEREEERTQKLVEFFDVAEKFSETCKLLMTGEPLLLAANELSLNDDDDAQISALFTDASGEQYVTHGVFKGEGVPPFSAVLLAAHSSVLTAAEQAGIDSLAERLSL